MPTPTSTLGCSIPDCPLPLYMKKICRRHYDRWSKTGSTELQERVYAKDSPCTVPGGCEFGLLIYADGLCRKHYDRQRRRGTTDAPYQVTREMFMCALFETEGCIRPVHARGLCQPHYRRWSRTGSTDNFYEMTAEERFLDNVSPPTSPQGCRLWTGNMDGKGYGRFHDPDRYLRGRTPW